MEYKIIFEVAIMLFLGLVFGKLSQYVKSPNVTGYLIAGLLIGPSFLNLIPKNMVGGFSVVSSMALGFIAFTIGSEFDLRYLKRVGISPFLIAISESFGAIILVSVVLILCGFDKNLSIMLGAIAAATAPAQTIMVINQYRAKGSLTSMLVSVVAFDDAVALIGFGIATTIVKAMSINNDTSIVLSILSPVYEILISFVIGFLIALIMKIMFKYFQEETNKLCVTISLILMTYWLAYICHGSPLLACMFLGGVLTNIYGNIKNISEILDSFSGPILMIFFVISGAGFEISALKDIGFLGLIYVVVRVIGKMAGAWFGGKITKQEDKICKYLGPTLMPQAGVALGLIVVASSIIPEFADQIRVVILCSTFIYSIIGPVVAKLALEKAGEIIIPNKK